jgi:dTDP-4-dehydrorhamnose reductase
VSIEGSLLLVGADGMLGKAWVVLLKRMGIEHSTATYPAFDLTDEANVRKAVSPNYKWVVNCAAWTDVDGAESREREAAKVNATGVGFLANACRRTDATLIHYSTDYVFHGEGSRPYATDAPHDPVNAYGRTKALGERLIVESGAKHLLLRTSWLYAPWGKNFVRTIADLARTRPELKVVDDQRGRPASAESLANVSLRLMERPSHATVADSIFHVTDGGECSWFEFAQAIVAKVNPGCRVSPCTTAEFPRPARRPAYSVLDIEKTERLLGKMRPWRENLAHVLETLEQP